LEIDYKAADVNRKVMIVVKDETQNIILYATPASKGWHALCFMLPGNVTSHFVALSLCLC